MATPRSLQLPEEGYSQEEERLFRRELEDYLLSISGEIDELKTLSGSETSSASKRSLLSSLPVGQTEVGPDAPSYLFGNKTISGTTWTGTNVLINQWPATMSGWTISESSDDWSEGSGGDLVYSGDRERVFRITWSSYCYGGISQNWARSLGRVTKKPSGGSHAQVDVSVKGSDFDYIAAGFGFYFHLDDISNTFMLSMSTGDAIAFDQGFAFSVFGGSDTTAWTIWLWETYDSGYNISIESVT